MRDFMVDLQNMENENNSNNSESDSIFKDGDINNDFELKGADFQDPLSTFRDWDDSANKIFDTMQSVEYGKEEVEKELKEQKELMEMDDPNKIEDIFCEECVSERECIEKRKEEKELFKEIGGELGQEVGKEEYGTLGGVAGKSMGEHYGESAADLKHDIEDGNVSENEDIKTMAGPGVSMAPSPSPRR